MRGACATWRRLEARLRAGDGHMLFSGYIVGYLFLAGAGSGAFFLASAGCVADAVLQSERSERLACALQPAFLAAPCLMALAGVLLVADLGEPARAWAVALMPFQSVMSVGAWLVALLTALSGAYALLGLTLPRIARVVQWAFCVLGLVLSAGVMSYTGLLLSDLVSIDFWNTPWLLALFVASSLSCGSAVALGSFGLFAHDDGDAACDLWRIAGALAVIELAFLLAFLASRWSFSAVSHASCLALASGDLRLAFWLGVVGAGFVLPLGVRLAGGLRSQARGAAGLVSCAGTLVGGLALRYCIIAAALYTPLALGAL